MHDDILILLLDGHNGVHIPRIFCEECTPAIGWVYSESDRQACLDPDCDYMWDAWANILDNAYFISPLNGKKYTLHQDDDLWAVQDGYGYNDAGYLINLETLEIIEP